MSDSSPHRLGIYGGTFDPIHLGHIACAKEVLDAHLVDEIILMPANIPSFKQDRQLASPEDRLAMAYLATEHISRLWVSAQEIQQGGVTYTVDTLRQLRSDYPDADLIFLLGADSASTLGSWHNAEELASLATFMVLTRPGYSFDNKLPACFNIQCVEAYTPDISSTQIRELLKQGGDVSSLLDPLVYDYIVSNNLYR